MMEVGRDRPKDAPFSVQSHDVFFSGEVTHFSPMNPWVFSWKIGRFFLKGNDFFVGDTPIFDLK